MSDREPVCITCGQSTASEAIGNKLPDGSSCPSCLERVLDAQPPLLPSFAFGTDEELEEEYELDEEMTITVEFEGDDDGPIGA